MRVHLIKKRSIEGWVANHANSRESFNRWLAALKQADWNKPEDILKTFSHADILGNGSDRVVFDIAGQRYRMICKYKFGISSLHLYVKWIGTHAEYTKLCNKRMQFVVSAF